MATYSMDWIGDLNFRSGEGEPALELFSQTPGKLSPMMTLAYAQIGCMGMDVAHVVTKGRHDLRAMKVTLDGERAPEPPRRYVTLKMHFDITGNIPDHVVERAIQLSRDKYCSVWNSLRADMRLETSFTVHAG
jgi:putative redox protein